MMRVDSIVNDIGLRLLTVQDMPLVMHSGRAQPVRRDVLS